jgi:hypothetical protein
MQVAQLSGTVRRRRATAEGRIDWMPPREINQLLR